METHVHRAWVARRHRHLGGSRGNEALTSVNAVVLVLLIVAQMITLLALESMIRVHLFVGVVLLGPVALKLATTGYRFVRYYTGARDYRAKGPPMPLLRAIAPVFVAATVGVFASGILMLSAGEADGAILDLHVVSFWVWIACLALHVLLNGREVLHHLRAEWLAGARARVPGAELRAGLVLASMLGGALVALALLSKITGFGAD